MSVFDMIASHFLVEHHGSAVFFIGIMIGIIVAVVLGNHILDNVIPIAGDAAFDFYDNYIEPKIILCNWNLNNTNSHSNITAPVVSTITTAQNVEEWRMSHCTAMPPPFQ